MISKKQLSETDICAKFITPAIIEAGWNEYSQVRREVTFTDGRIIVQGSVYTRGKKKRADYILYYKRNIPIAIVEAKDNKHSIDAGIQQGMDYAKILDVPFVFSSNGDGFIFHDRTDGAEQIERELALSEFPSPEYLWNKYLATKELDHVEKRNVVEQEYRSDDSGKSPRYYQQIAVNRTIEAIAKGQDRILLVMATGTGKTYTAFNIAWRLWRAEKVKRVLFLADRNVLLSQTKNGDFKPFGSEIMNIIKHRKVDKAYQVYFALYQGLTGTEEEQNAYKKFSKDFFDLVIVDECHRGSAREASAWRDVLSYFDSAIHLGLTATPKETKDISNIAYFGQPIYTYSLKQGIEDGFLAPYKVVRVSMDVDEGYRPEKGKVDKYGHEIEDRIYNLKDYDRNLVIDDRTQQVARKLSEYLKKTDRYAKTIVFCVDIDHANRMRRALINENADMVKKHENYVVKITGDDEEGKRELDRFTDVESPTPVIATTSKMLTTGVDTKMVKVIVLDANIGSMTEFKQIIGRGTRLREEEGKVYFTILDFRKATNLFADPDFDGYPVQVYEPTETDDIVPPEVGDTEIQVTPGEEMIQVPTSEQVFIRNDFSDKHRKYYVKDVPVKVINERVQYYGADGKLITESLIDYTKKNIRGTFASLDEFLLKWNNTEKKSVLLEELAEKGVLLEALRDEVGKDMDAFDLVCHVAFDQPPLTRKERAKSVKKRDYFTRYGDTARKVLEALLEKYENEGVTTFDSGEVLNIKPISDYGTPMEIAMSFGSLDEYKKALQELENEIYKSA